jgi:hypothetical protein
MRFIVAFLLTALLSFAAALFFPWWIIAVAAFVVSVAVNQPAIGSFVAAFFSVFILWACQAYYLDAENEHLLSKKVAAILPLGGSSIAIIFVTALVGAVVAGMAALTGSFVRPKTFRKKVKVEKA